MTTSDGNMGAALTMDGLLLVAPTLTVRDPRRKLTGPSAREGSGAGAGVQYVFYLVGGADSGLSLLRIRRLDL